MNKIKEFLIILGVETAVQESMITEQPNGSPFQYFNIGKLNPYYWKARKDLEGENG